MSNRPQGFRVLASPLGVAILDVSLRFSSRFSVTFSAAYHLQVEGRNGGVASVAQRCREEV